MTLSSFQQEVEEVVARLIDMARELTYNSISENCKFILTEIENSGKSSRVQRYADKRENDRKVPVKLSELMPTLQSIYHNLYDINLHIYRSTKDVTIIDFRYFPKSSLDLDFRERVSNKPPMLHGKVALPPWLGDKQEKFDIIWEH